MFAGVGERTREGNDLYREMQESVSCALVCLTPTLFPHASVTGFVSKFCLHMLLRCCRELLLPFFRAQGVIKMGDKRGESKVTLVYGQMNEPPGARARVALTGGSGGTSLQFPLHAPPAYMRNPTHRTSLRPDCGRVLP